MHIDCFNEETSANRSDNMRLVDWNSQWGRGVDGRVDLSRIVTEAKAPHDFDVLVLQEVARGFHEGEQAGGLKGGPSADQFAELEALVPGATVIDGIGSDLPPVGNGVTRRQFGNAIVSRLPLRQVLRHSLPWPADPAKPSMMLRIALEAVIETDVGPVRIISTHLEFYSEKQRLAQVARLHELHAEACAHAHQPAHAESQASPFADTARPLSAIACGDFNSVFGDSAYNAMLDPIADAPSFIDAWTCSHPHDARAATVGLYNRDQWPDGPFACDFIFVTEDLRARIVSDARRISGAVRRTISHCGSNCADIAMMEPSDNRWKRSRSRCLSLN